jgi:ribose transport system substrate-binding protein
MYHPLSQLLKSKVLVMMTIGVLLLLSTACGGAPPPQAAPPTAAPDKAATTAPQEIVIGLSLSEFYPFLLTVRDGAEEAAKLSGVKLIVADNPKEDPEQQAAQIQALIDQGANALLVNPTANSEKLIPIFEAAAKAGIPVFTIDRSAAGGPITSHIASDNLAGGKMAGEYLVQAMGETGKVVELEGVLNTSAAQMRGGGFNEVIAAHQGIEVVAKESAEFSQEKAKEVFARILTEQPEIDAVFAHNDDMILGAIEAAKEANRANDIIFIGFDGVEAAVDAVEAGDLTATIAQQPDEMGRLGVETAVKYLKGETVPESIPVNLAVVTK